MKSDSPPACSLDASDFQRRVAWIEQLNERLLRGSKRTGRYLELEYAPAAFDEVSELVRREARCCEFLTFDLSRDAQSVTLRIGVPDRLAARTDELLAPFSGRMPGPRADCCGNCGSTDETSAAVSSNTVAGTALGSAATAVVACAACCVLPLAFPAIAAGALGGVLAWLGGAHLWLTFVAILLVVGAWIWIWRQSAKRNARAAPMTLGLMTAASLATVLAMAWPFLEGPLMRAIGSA